MCKRVRYDKNVQRFWEQNIRTDFELYFGMQTIIKCLKHKKYDSVGGIITLLSSVLKGEVYEAKKERVYCIGASFVTLLCM